MKSVEQVEFDWDEANRDHLALHSVGPEEAEQVILDPNAVLLVIQTNTGEERTKALGMTNAGRILNVVFTFRGEALRPITAYPASTPQQRFYLQQR